MSLIDLDRQLMASPLSVDMMMTSLNFDTDTSIAPIFSGIQLCDTTFSGGLCTSGGVLQQANNNNNSYGAYNSLNDHNRQQRVYFDNNHSSNHNGNGYHHQPVSVSIAMDTMKSEPEGSLDEYSSSSSPGSSSAITSPEQMSPGSVRARKAKDDKLCGVCGDKALGYNFDAISCESCKAFFRRNAPKGLEYFKCPYDEKCKMDISNRRFCKRCRLKMCFAIGMKKEYILTEDEKSKKKQKIEENRMIREMEKAGVSTVTPEPAPASVQAPLAQLSEDDAAAIEELVRAYDESLLIRIDGALPHEMASSVLDLTNIAEVSVRRVIDMAKKVKKFKTLSQTDQISLLKGGSIELLIIRSVLTYDKDKNHFLDPTDTEDMSALSVQRLQQAEQGMGLFDDHMKFVKALAIDLKADKTSLILLLMIALFSPDRPTLEQKELISAEQERYSVLLQRYLESQHPVAVAHAIYPKMLMKLTDIRDLSEKQSHVLLKINHEGLQPLMKEVLDLGQN